LENCCRSANADDFLDNVCRYWMMSILPVSHLTVSFRSLLTSAPFN
jgi:hypothetical protein